MMNCLLSGVGGESPFSICQFMANIAVKSERRERVKEIDEAYIVYANTHVKHDLLLYSHSVKNFVLYILNILIRFLITFVLFFTKKNLVCTH